MPARPHVAATRIFVVGFDDLDERGLSELFAPYGQVTFVEIVRTQGPGRHFAFVDLSPPSAAAVAINDLHRTLLDGRRITVQRARDTTTGARALREVIADMDEPEIEEVVRFAREVLGRRRHGAPEGA